MRGTVSPKVKKNSSKGVGRSGKRRETNFKGFNKVTSVESRKSNAPEEYSTDDSTSEEDAPYSEHLETDEENDKQKHLRVLEEITGIPSEAFQGGKKSKKTLVSEPYPESEFNPTRDVLENENPLTIEDLIDPLKGKAEYSQLRKRTREINRKSETLSAPLPKVEKDRAERIAAYEESKREITKWDPIVKRNREAPTIIFDRDTQVGYSTVGAIASEFTPRTQFEKKMAGLVSATDLVKAHKEDGAKLLEFNKISVDEYRKQRNQIAKMRSMLFNHEVKMKRIKKIKSKTFHRIMKKGKSKMGTVLDEETAKEEAMKQEKKRAEERMTLRHRNRSKWAKRVLERGLSVQDEGTRAAIAEQLNEHSRLTRKIKSMNDESSEGSGDEDDDDVASGSDEESELLMKAKEKTMKLMEEDVHVPETGVMSLPFMVRGLKRKEEAAKEEAKRVLDEYDESLHRIGNGCVENKEAPKGRMVFGPPANQDKKPEKVDRSDNDSPRGVVDEREIVNSESEDDDVEAHVPEQTYTLPSQVELVREAFAGDDVENEFKREKEEMLNEENPEVEKPVLIPGWGQWTHVQKSKGLPGWMVDEHERAKRKRDEALRRRKDANLRHVIISEKLDKKTEQLHVKSVPYPFTSQEVFEQSMRMPIGPEFNPVSAVGPLNRPEVMKRPGVIIKPVKFEKVDLHKKAESKTERPQQTRNILKPVLSKS